MKKIALSILSLFLTVSASALDLTLADCREMALQSNENMRIAENNVSGAGLDRDVARTQYLPKLSGSATALYSAPDSELGNMMTMQIRGA